MLITPFPAKPFRLWKGPPRLLIHLSLALTLAEIPLFEVYKGRKETQRGSAAWRTKKGQGHSWKAFFVALRLQRFVIFSQPQDNLGGRGRKWRHMWFWSKRIWPGTQFSAFPGQCLSPKDPMCRSQLLRLGVILQQLAQLHLWAVFLSGLKIKSWSVGVNGDFWMCLLENKGKASAWNHRNFLF